jgi:hypothetical protein
MIKSSNKVELRSKRFGDWQLSVSLVARIHVNNIPIAASYSIEPTTKVDKHDSKTIDITAKENFFKIFGGSTYKYIKELSNKYPHIMLHLPYGEQQPRDSADSGSGYIMFSIFGQDAYIIDLKIGELKYADGSNDSQRLYAEAYFKEIQNNFKLLNGSDLYVEQIYVIETIEGVIEFTAESEALDYMKSKIVDIINSYLDAEGHPKIKRYEL